MDYQFGYPFRRIRNAYEQIFNNKLRPYGITISQIEILAYLCVNSGRTIVLKDLEREFHLNHSTVIGIIRRLEDKGYVSSKSCDFDRRSRIIAATEAGMEFTASMKENIDSIDRLVTRNMTEEQAEQLYGLLLIAMDNLKIRKEG
ncbi:MAG: MarR family winged helix-turn-helix transcriptional regulator [Oscillospiraceae bacterium]|jgi:DNA-binding MarR family transcriptional regulator